MKLSLTSWSLPACTLQEAAHISKALGINELDVGLLYRSSLDRKQMITDPQSVAYKVRSLGIAIPNYYHLFCLGLFDRNLACQERLNKISPTSNGLSSSAVLPTSGPFSCFLASSTLDSLVMMP